MLINGRCSFARFLGIMLLFSVQLVCAEDTDRRNILVLMSYHPQLPWSSDFRRGLHNAGNDLPAELFIETMDHWRIREPLSDRSYADYLRRKYASVKLDAVVAESIHAVDFVLREGQQTFGDLPFILIPPARPDSSHLKQSVTISVGLNRYDPETVRWALKQNPQTRHIFVIGHNSARSASRLQQLLPTLRRLASGIDIEVLTRYRIEDLERTLGALPDNSLVFYTSVFSDDSERRFIPRDVATRVAEASSAPVYSFLESFIGSGIVGGYLVSAELTARRATEAAFDLISGIPASRYVISRPVFDSRALKRWQIDDDKLPPEADVRFQPHSILEEYFGEVITGLLAIALLASILGAFVLLFLQRNRSNRQLSLLNRNLERRVEERTRKLRELMIRDSLTGLLSRREFYRRASEEAERSERHSHNYCIAWLDIDLFKKINDHYGHPEGDVVLRAFAALAAASIRRSDIAGRVGGEEFAILMPETRLDQAAVVLKKICGKVAQSPIPLPDGQRVSITVSIGCACSDNGTRSVNDIIKLADQQLYRAKQKGRNRVELQPCSSSGIVDDALSEPPG